METSILLLFNNNNNTMSKKEIRKRYKLSVTLTKSVISSCGDILTLKNGKTAINLKTQIT